MQKRVLILEDDPDWQELYREDFERWDWNVEVTDSIPLAISLLIKGDVFFDLVLADKGGTNGLYGKHPDKYGHRDGLAVLRTSKDLYPDTQIRVLSTGEKWSFSVFNDSTLGLNAFMEKTGDFHAFYKWLREAKPGITEKPQIFLYKFEGRGSGKEKYY